ncbi:restriction endonuclease subunit S [Paenarthrobacter ureafaciens]|uniref:restriction endonuclease subunit S n=1 Tax=Paenarthrobacter ureafaciens TaxID=37931 RepID=UPI0015B9820D|nr:restriction endonuclease subunit S [Paenarthrobacter ureafaciens]NWL27972.1 restriction endonuclease subunit S [Paenarthrobacter ureafaciens]
MLLADVARITSGLTVRERLDASFSGVLAIQMADLSINRDLDVRSMARVPSPHPRYMVSRGDVLLRSRGHATTAWAVPDDLPEPAIAVLPLFIIRPSTDIYDPDFLAWWLNQQNAQTHLRRAAQGQSIQMVSKTALESVPLHLPPLAQQRLIAKASHLATREAQLMHRLAECQHTLRRSQLITAAALPGQNHTKAP